MKKIFLISLLFCAAFLLLVLSSSCSKEKDPEITQVIVPDTTQTEALAFSAVWIDSINPSRKVTFANVIQSNQFIGIDELYGDSGVMNLSGFITGRNLAYTVIIKYKPPGYNKRYISYTGMITDTAAAHKRITVYSELDTLYLKPR